MEEIFFSKNWRRRYDCHEYNLLFPKFHKSCSSVNSNHKYATLKAIKSELYLEWNSCAIEK